FSWAVSAGKARVWQKPSAETTEGTGIFINCSHPKIKNFDFINFYRQVPGRSPTFIIYGQAGSKAVKTPAGSLTVAANRGSSALWISRPRRGDAGVYYCALGT
ncbi:TVAZ2 protein, partial [Alcedo cyanopectus]|nr:TVAZ2 protein [Ceyx cyanopectus]